MNLHLPKIESHSYPFATMVEYIYNKPAGVALSVQPVVTEAAYLMALRTSDLLFAQQLHDDGALQDAYEKMRRSEIKAEMIEMNTNLKSQLLTIERAFKIRMKFAIYQKHRVLTDLLYVESDTEKERIIREANEELKIVLSILRDWESDEIRNLVSNGRHALLLSSVVNGGKENDENATPNP